MSLGSFFTRALDAITPWDRGGEFQRRDERRRREEEERARQQARQFSAPNAPQVRNAPVQNQLPEPKKPANIFENLNLNKNLVFNKPQNVVSDFQKPQVVEPPQPGTVVKPRTPEDHINAGLDAGKSWEQISRETNVPINSVRNYSQKTRPNYGIKTKLPESRFKYGVLADPNRRKQFLEDLAKPTTGLPSNLGIFGKAVGNVAKDLVLAPVRGARILASTPIESGRSLLAQATGNKKAQQAAEYRQNVNLFRKEGANKIARGEKLGWMDPLSSAGDVVSVFPGFKGLSIAAKGAREAVATKSLAPLAREGLKGLDEIALGIRNVFKRPNVTPLTDDIGDVLTETDVKDLTTRNIPVGEGIEVKAPRTEPVNIPVRDITPRGPMINEGLGQKPPNLTRIPTPEEAVVKRAADRFANRPATRPDRSIEGVTSRTPEKPYALTPETVATGQNKVIDDYADMLRDVGEGNGVNINRATGKRISNNYRPEVGSGKMTKAQWREEAERQLKAGKAESGVQKAFDDVANPEVQSTLAEGEQVLPPEGRPITVKEAKGINVIDKTEVPQNLPETPGQVRLTANTEPVKVKSEAVVAETPPVVSTTKTGEAIENIPATPKQADEALDGAYERLVKSLRENQAAQKVEKKINSAEKSRRFAEKERIYNELVDSGVSRKEAEARATAALKGKYTDNVVANFDVDSKQAEAFRKAIDEVSDDPFNTKRAFEHMIDPNKTDPLQPWERTRIRRFVQSTLGEDAAQSLDEALIVAEKAGDRGLMGRVSSEFTSAIAAGDISATGRQGLFGLINHPGMSKDAFVDAIKSLKSPEEYKAFANKLTNDPNTAFIQEQMGGKYQTLSDIADEARGGDTSNKLTSWYVNPSNRHYNTYLDSLRHQQKSAIIERYGGQEGFLKAAQAANPENPDKWMKAWNRVVDTMSGRGTLTKGTGSPTIGDVQVLFSWRNLVSKFQKLTAPAHLGLLRTNKDAYLYQLREVAQPAAVLGTTLALVGASGAAEIENGKIKIGDTRIDITGGIATITNAANKMYQAFTDESKSGYGDRTAGDIATDFFKNQLSPMLGTIARLADMRPAKGEDKYGNELNLGWFLDKAPIPSIAHTAIDSVKGGENLFQTAANVFAEGLGFGTTTYQTADDKKAAKIGKENFKNLKDTAKQLEKEGISTANDDVKNYISDGEYNKAYRAREYQLMEAKAEPNASPTKIKRAESALQEVQLREQGVPLEKDEIQATVEEGDYDKALQGLNHQLSSLEGASKAKRKPIETDIKRLEITRDGNFDPSIVKLYESMSNTEWRKMGDPKSEDHDPDLYQMLWDYDTKMAEAGVSRSSFKPDKQKYSAKKSGSGRGGRGSRNIDTSFGTLGNFSFAPKVQQYAGIDSKSGAVPHIAVQRPNIVHKITSSG